MSESWKPRPHDHVVEPMFTGLDVQPECKPSRRRRWLAVALVAAAALAVWAVVAIS
jgi:hypothetical protein